MPKEYLIFCDESDEDGRYFCNFYGGVIVDSSHYQAVTERLDALKYRLNLFGEIKWSKVTERYLEKYVEIVRGFFAEITAGVLRVRIMFRAKAAEPTGLTTEQTELGYFLLYYQFIKHAFGLELAPMENATNLRLYFDDFPANREKVAAFKGFLLGLAQSPKWRDAGLMLSHENITEVRSHEHVLLQCLDIVLGAMSFRLNDKHREKPPGQRIRGKRTRAKEALYKEILRLIRELLPGFNVGTSTGMRDDIHAKWNHPYSHWSFIPKEFRWQTQHAKSQGKRNDPAAPT